MKERRYDIDWLRALATFGIFFFHCARFFDTGGWHLKNTDQSDIVTVLVGFFDLWEMPIFFLLSGVGSWYALRSKVGGQYLFERVKRLLIPLYTVGVFILLPPQLLLGLREWFQVSPELALANQYLACASVVSPVSLSHISLAAAVASLPQIRIRSEGNRKVGWVVRSPGWHIPIPHPPGSRADRSERFLSGVP